MYLLSLAARAAPLPGLTRTKTAPACTRHFASSKHRPCAVTNTCSHAWLTVLSCGPTPAAAHAVASAFDQYVSDCISEGEWRTYRIKGHARLQLRTVICGLQQTVELSDFLHASVAKAKVYILQPLQQGRRCQCHLKALSTVG